MRSGELAGLNTIVPAGVVGKLLLDDPRPIGHSWASRGATNKRHCQTFGNKYITNILAIYGQNSTLTTVVARLGPQRAGRTRT